MFEDFFLLSFNNLRRRKLRSWLTIIGIFIGIAAIVGLISIGQGLENVINEQFEQLGKDKIIIMPKVLGPPGTAVSDELKLTSNDLEVVENVRGVEWAIGFISKQGQVKGRGGETAVTYFLGGKPDDYKLFKGMADFDILKGRWLEDGDKYKVMVGYNHIYGDIWDKPLAIGRSIVVGEQEFKIIGVATKIGNPIDDSQIYFMKDTLKEILDIEDEESQILAKTASGFDPADVGETIERKLRQHKDEKEGEESFSVSTSEQLLDTFGDILAVVQGVLVGIAAISLIVGGIGIMNTMYTSILERTKEIGVMKAIGAKNSDILLIFLIESGLIGLIGGIIGIILGMGMGKASEIIGNQALGTELLKVSFDPMLIIGALLFSFTIGAIAGVFPAYQASKLKPVDALRYE